MRTSRPGNLSSPTRSPASSTPARPSTRSRTSTPSSRRSPPTPSELRLTQRKGPDPPRRRIGRSEEHTSELQSRGHLVCRLLLEKKKTRAPPRRTPSYAHPHSLTPTLPTDTASHR